MDGCGLEVGKRKDVAKTGCWIPNRPLRALFPRLSFPTTPIPDDEPWRVIAPGLDGLEIDELLHGWIFLASGTSKPTGP